MNESLEIESKRTIQWKTVVKALVTEITTAQSQGAPIIVPASIITKYCPTASLWQEKQPTKSTPPSSTNLATTPAPRNATTKRDHNTPEGGTPKEPSQQQKKTRRGPGVERPAFIKSEMGTLYLTNPAMKLGSVFPKELAVALCAYHMCKGVGLLWPIAKCIITFWYDITGAISVGDY